jgi:hypothetical protein
LKRTGPGSTSRWTLYTFMVTAVIIAAGSLLFSDEAEASGSGTRVIRSDNSSVVFEITVPRPRIIRESEGAIVALEGYGTFSPPGAPVLPARTFNVAVPAQGDPSVSWTVTESETLGPIPLARVPAERFIRYGEDGIPVTEAYMPEDPWGGSMPTETVVATQPAMMGRQRVMPVRLMPLMGHDGSFTLARKIVVTVSFGLSPGLSEKRPGTAAAPVLSGVWKRMYERVLVNPGDTERLISPLKDRAALRAPMAPGRRLKIKIPETGVYSVRADSLIASGLSPSLSNNGFALRKLYYDASEPDLVREEDIPYRVIKGSGSAADIFEGDDRLVFFARAVKDDIGAGDTMAVFNTYNRIWLFEDEAGAVMPDGQGFPSGTGRLQTSFVHSEKIRKDTWYNKFVKAGMKDFNFAGGPQRDEVAVPFQVHNAQPGSIISVYVRVMGYVKGNPSQDLDFYIRNSGGTSLIGSGFISSTDEKVFDFGMIPVTRLAEGANQLVVKSREETYGFLINDAVVRYSRMTALHDGYLDLSVSQDLSSRRIDITGFSGQSGYLVELTDPDAPSFNDIPADSFRADGSSYTLSLTVPAATDRRFVALGRGAGMHISNVWIEPDAASALRSSPGPYNTLVIAHSDFLPPVSDYLASYISWREAQGYRILRADVEDVYDEFNGGLISADAIRRFVRYGVENWGVEFVLLIGDASEDHRRIFIGDPPESNGSAPDYVPAFTYSVNVIGREKDEVVTADKYYAFLDESPPSGYGVASSEALLSHGGSGIQYLPAAAYPDVIVGRLPVGREIELRALLTKMYRFEEPSGSDAWRRSIVLFSDDAWSGYLSAYAYHSIEEHFEYGMDSVATKIEESLPGGFEVNRLDLSRWTDGVHDDLTGGTAILSEATDSTRKYFTPYLNRKLNNGCLFYSFQGHASRSNFSTEAGFSNFSQYQDVDSLRSDRNHIFFGVGCHISDFALMMEYSRSGVDGPNGDCITEQLLFKSRAGAVGTYASTGYEYLLENKYFCTTMHEVIFQRPPTDPIPPENAQTGARWILGEALTAGEIEHLGLESYAYEQVYRYVLLGDPMLRVDPGPPLMTVSADWGEGMEEISSDTLRSRSSLNTCSLMFRASDVVGLGDISFEIDGEDRTGDLSVVPTIDEGLDFARGYSASVDYTVNLDDHSLIFRTHSPDGGETGFRELHVALSMMLYNGSLAIPPGGESPSEGAFLLDMRFPVWLDSPPEIMFDGIGLDGVTVQAPDPQDSTAWQARFSRKLAAGNHVLTVTVGDFEAEYPFSVGGSGLVMDAFNFPNPFDGGTNICFSLNIDADAGKIMIFNVSGMLIRELAIPRDLLGAAPPGAPNAVWWDGRDLAGDTVANGTYIYVIDIEKDGGKVSYTGKAVHLE